MMAPTESCPVNKVYEIGLGRCLPCSRVCNPLEALMYLCEEGCPEYKLSIASNQQVTDGLSGGPIAGIVLSVLVLAAVAGILFFIYRKKRKKTPEDAERGIHAQPSEENIDGEQSHPADHQHLMQGTALVNG